MFDRNVIYRKRGKPWNSLVPVSKSMDRDYVRPLGNNNASKKQTHGSHHSVDKLFSISRRTRYYRCFMVQTIISGNIVSSQVRDYNRGLSSPARGIRRERCTDLNSADRIAKIVYNSRSQKARRLCFQLFGLKSN